MLFCEEGKEWKLQGHIDKLEVPRHNRVVLQYLPFALQLKAVTILGCVTGEIQS